MLNEGFYLEVKVDSSRDKMFYYCLDNSLKKGDYVVVETGFGLEVGVLTKDPIKESESKNQSTKQIVRVANDEDLNFYNANKKYNKEAEKIFKERLMVKFSKLVKNTHLQSYKA